MKEITLKHQEKCQEIIDSLAKEGFTIEPECFRPVHAYPDIYVMLIEFNKPKDGEPDQKERAELALNILSKFGIDEKTTKEPDALIMFPKGDKVILALWLKKDAIDQLVKSIDPRA